MDCRKAAIAPRIAAATPAPRKPAPVAELVSFLPELSLESSLLASSWLASSSGVVPVLSWSSGLVSPSSSGLESLANHQSWMIRLATSVLSMYLPRTGSSPVALARMSSEPAPLKKKGTTWLVCSPEYHWCSGALPSSPVCGFQDSVSSLPER